MSLLDNQVTALREQLASADGNDGCSFEKVVSAFFDITDTTGLIAASEPTEDEYTRALLENMSRQHCRDPELELVDLMILRYAPAGLYHGGFIASDSFGSFFVFREAQQGIVTFLTLGTMHYYRTTTTILPANANFIRRRAGKPN